MLPGGFKEKEMYLWQNLEYGKAGAMVHERDPREYGWGYFATDTIPGSGVGLFVWFETPAELLAFLEKIEVQGLEDKQTAKEVVKIIKKAELKDTLTEDLRKQTNKALKDIEIKWWGKFTDLYTGKNKFSREILTAYFGSPQGNDPERVYIPRFIDFCTNWGH
jgi:hypothetical protein